MYLLLNKNKLFNKTLDMEEITVSFDLLRSKYLMALDSEIYDDLLQGATENELETEIDRRHEYA